MPELLFEIGVEELPALSIEPAIAFMKSNLAERFLALRLTHKAIEAYGTPRRLVVMVDELAHTQEDFKEEILGPSINIAFDDTGALSKAGLGFISAKGLTRDQIYRKVTDKGEVIAAHKIEIGRKTKDLLPELLIGMMREIPFKKRMRWEKTGETFARPVRSLLCLFNGETVPFSFADVEASNESRGHRFMNPEPFKVTSKEQYLSEMKNRYVILSVEEREALIVKGANEKLSPLNAKFRNDSDLMATVRNLCEYPFVILGTFEEKYLKLPHEILICEMKAHQKCFAVHNKKGELMPYFICSAGTKPYDEEAFAKGNARVIRARFEDGAFYFAEDQKKTLYEHALGLANVVFERELGTVADKSARIENVALCLARNFSLYDETSDLIKKTAPILKADLVTGVVGQFPELQGVMGHIYATLEGEDPKVGEIIETHYWPRFAEDKLPRLKSAALFSIADRLDTLVGIIAVLKKPSGNKDPFGLRRAAIGIVRMLIHFDFSINIESMIDLSLMSYGDRFHKKSKEISLVVKDFLMQRARGVLIDDLSKDSKEYAVNFADSVLLVGGHDLLDAFARAQTLHAMHNKNKEDFASLIQAFKRAGNIVKKACGDKIFTLEPSYIPLLSLPAELDLLHAVNHTKDLMDKQVGVGFAGLNMMYSEIFSQVAMIKPKLDTFFDTVMVMVDDIKVRNARLALLSEIKGVADRIADFTHL